MKTSTILARSGIGRRAALAGSLGAAVVAAVVGSLAVGSPVSAFQPVQPVPSDSAADPARQGLAAFLAAQAASGSIDLDVCPVLAESDLMAAAGAFGPVGTFTDRSFAVDDDEGVTCELTRDEGSAPLGAVTGVGMGVWDFAGLPAVTEWIAAMPVTEVVPAAGGAVHGYCEESGENFECYQFWMLDGLVVGNYVTFAQYDGLERPDSPKEPLPVVGQILAAQLPMVLSTTAALAGSPPVS